MMVHVDAARLGGLLRRGRRERTVTGEPEGGQATTEERSTIERQGRSAIVAAGAVVQQWASAAHGSSSLRLGT
jgi:hypothetical protein